MSDPYVADGKQDDEQRARSVARDLVRTGAVAFGIAPFFTFTSGVSSPIYVDNRRLLGFVPERRRVVAELVDFVSRVYGTDVDAVAGTATAGIAWAAWTADKLDLPMLYVRSVAKKWGQQRAVEGVADPGARVLLLEDLAFSGGSLVAAATNLRDSGYEVLSCATIVSYEMPVARRNYSSVGLRHDSLTTVDLALAEAVASGRLEEAASETVREWLTTNRTEQAVSPTDKERAGP